MATTLKDFCTILKDLGSEFESICDLISKFLLAELPFTDRPSAILRVQTNAFRVAPSFDSPIGLGGFAKRKEFHEPGVKICSYIE